MIVAHAGECGGADQSFGAGPIFDHNRLLPALTQLFSKWAGGTVGAGREGRDHADRALRPWLAGLRERGGQGEHARNSDRKRAKAHCSVNHGTLIVQSHQQVLQSWPEPLKVKAVFYDRDIRWL